MAGYAYRDMRAWLNYYEANGRNASATARHFGIPRSTFTRWLGRYEPDHPVRSLKPESRRPHRTKQPTYSLAELAALSEIARRNPRWGAGRLQAAMAAHGLLRSRATVGRMLAAINRRCPVCSLRGGRHSAMMHEVMHPFHRQLGMEGQFLKTPPRPSRHKHSRTVGEVEAYLAEVRRHRGK